MNSTSDNHNELSISVPRKFVKLTNERRIVLVKSSHENRKLSPPVTSTEQNDDPHSSDRYLFQTVKETLEILLQKVERNLSTLQAQLDEFRQEISVLAIFPPKINSINNVDCSKSLQNLVGDAIIERPSCSVRLAQKEAQLTAAQTEDVYKHLRRLTKTKSTENSCTNVLKRRKVLIKQPNFESGEMLDLEPGEVPDPDYLPLASLCADRRRVYFRVYPCDHGLMDVPFQL